jgi:hypothetical protein
VEGPRDQCSFTAKTNVSQSGKVYALTMCEYMDAYRRVRLSCFIQLYCLKHFQRRFFSSISCAVFGALIVLQQQRMVLALGIASLEASFSKTSQWDLEYICNRDLEALVTISCPGG